MLLKQKCAEYLCYCNRNGSLLPENDVLYYPETQEGSKCCRVMSNEIRNGRGNFPIVKVVISYRDQIYLLDSDATPDPVNPICNL